MAAEYSMLVRNCNSGYPRYYGVQIDPLTNAETYVELSQSEYLALGGSGTGCPPRFMTNVNGNEYTPILRQKRPVVLADVINLTALRNFNFGKAEMLKIQQLLPFRPMMVAILRNNKIPVSNELNLVEIASKYAELIGAASLSNSEKGAIITGESKSMDWGSLAGGVMDIFGTLINGITSGNIQQNLTTYVNNYVGYMNTDFAVIEEKLNTQGAQEALNALRSYKNGSWAELNAFIENFCSANNLPVPAVIKTWQQKQKDKEAELVQAVNNINTGNSTTPNGEPAQNNSNNSSSPDTMKKVLPYILGSVFLLIIIIVAIALLRSGKN